MLVCVSVCVCVCVCVPSTHKWKTHSARQIANEETKIRALHNKRTEKVTQPIQFSSCWSNQSEFISELYWIESTWLELSLSFLAGTFVRSLACSLAQIRNFRIYIWNHKLFFSFLMLKCRLCTLLSDGLSDIHEIQKGSTVRHCFK